MGSEGNGQIVIPRAWQFQQRLVARAAQRRLPLLSVLVAAAAVAGASGGLVVWWWPFGPAIVAAGVLAAAVIAGLMLGVVTGRDLAVAGVVMAAVAVAGAVGLGIAAGSPAAIAAFAVVALWFALARFLGPVEGAVVVIAGALPFYQTGWLSLTSGVGPLTIALGLIAGSLAWRSPRSLLVAVRSRRIAVLAVFVGLAVASLVLVPRGSYSLILAKVYIGRALLMPALIFAAFAAMERSRAIRLLAAIRTLVVAVGAVGGVLSAVQVGAGVGYPQAWVPSVAQFVGERAIGFSDGAGTWAAFLLLALALAVAHWRRAPSLEYGVATAAIALGIVLSGLRTAWVLLLLVALAAALAPGTRRRLRVAIPVGVVAVVAGALVLPGFQTSLTGGRSLWSAVGSGHGRFGGDESAHTRLLLMRAELKLGVRHPLTGVGLGNIGESLGELHESYKTESGVRLLVPGVPIEKHNIFTGLFAELGIPGIAAFLVLLGTGALALGRALRRARDQPERALVEGLVAAFVATVLLGISVEVDTQVYLWWILGTAFALERIVTAKREAEPR